MTRALPPGYQKRPHQGAEGEPYARCWESGLALDFRHVHPELRFEPLADHASVTPVGRGQGRAFPAEQDGFVGLGEKGELLDDLGGVELLQDGEVQRQVLVVRHFQHVRVWGESAIGGIRHAPRLVSGNGNPAWGPAGEGEEARRFHSPDPNGVNPVGYGGKAARSRASGRGCPYDSGSA